ncbi:MAG: hypothetical protein WDZ51_08250 [Pirellulaceae bacterium]
MLYRFLGWLVGIEDASTVDRVDLSLAAPWAENDPVWPLLGCGFALALAWWYYHRIQTGLTTRRRWILTATRGAILVMLIITLADPTARVVSQNQLSPVLYVVFDGTGSMEVHDELTPEEAEALAAAVSAPGGSATLSGDGTSSLSRLEWIQSYLRKEDNNLLTKLQAQHDLEIETFIFDGETTSSARRLGQIGGEANSLTPEDLADKLTTSGRVTALGDMLADLAMQSNRRLAGIVLVSDFAHNSGLAPLGSDGSGQSPLERLGVPVHTIGIGAVSTKDLAVEVQPPVKMKKAERSSIAVRLSQSGLIGEVAQVRVTARPLDGDGTPREGETSGEEEMLVGTQQVPLESSIQYLDFPFTPELAGRFLFTAEVEPLPGEVSRDNNRSSRSVNIIDDFLRLVYIENEPSWEWRFVKEVFHRDRLVGLEGFRTYLRSADPKVRQTNEMFLTTLTPRRSDFFANDVVFLGDMPSDALNERFGRMLKEFVGQFGGGLVVVAGPNFGPSHLAGTEIADMLPVRLDSTLSIRDDMPFTMQITPWGQQADFMQLGGDQSSASGVGEEGTAAWRYLGKLPWYQPVVGVHSQATVLAQHPYDLCADGQTPQPLIATRRYGNGEVVYIGFNELWRLRRMHGERYYRQFWSQIITRLGLSHALGSQKRFVVSTDRQTYQVDEKVALTVEAYDENFDPLRLEETAQSSLTAQITGEGALAAIREEVQLSQLRPGRFEGRFSAFESGRYSVKVLDPIAGTHSEIRFEVTGATAEQRNPARNLPLQQSIAATSGGGSFELPTADRLLQQISVPEIEEEVSRSYPMWATPLWFVLLVGLLFSEWLFRKRANLA